MDLVKTIFCALLRTFILLCVYSFLAFFSFSFCFLAFYFTCEILDYQSFFFDLLNFMLLHKTFTISIIVVINIFGFIYFLYRFAQTMLKLNPDLKSFVKDIK